jgi:small subunit ribosomal protein S17
MPVNHKKFRKFEGIVTADKMDKTVVVKINRLVMHPKYKKRYVTSRKYKCHDAKNQYKVGDKVAFVECRPYSKDKRWRVVKMI